MCINAVSVSQAHRLTMVNVHTLPDKWLLASIAPCGTDLEVCVMDFSGIHAVGFPCRKTRIEWVDATTIKRIDIQPTHWRLWKQAKGRKPK
jgi:hypothetical protein